jgi:hemerythrin-like domain-containing protein
MRPTEELKAEHQVIMAMLGVLRNVAKLLEAGKPVNADHLDQAVTFIREFADRCHHGKEEDFLFKAMARAGAPVKGGPIGAMLTEHDHGRAFVREMAAAAEDYRLNGGDTEAGKRYAKNALAYVHLLAQHIDKEDNVLYAIADRALPESEQTELERGFAKVESERMGEGRHREFHELVDRFQETYVFAA